MLILTVLQGPDKGRRFELPDNEPQVIGRSSEALPLTDQSISRRHAELTPDNGRWSINDQESANGTYVNGQRVTRRRVLHPGDQIRTGLTLLLFGVEAAAMRQHGVRVARAGEMDVAVTSTVLSKDDSMILAIPEPSEAAALHLKVIYDLTQLIGSTLEQQELLDRVMDLIFEYFQADRGFILLMKENSEKPDPVVVRHRLPPKKKQDSQITVSRTIVHHVVSKGEGVLSANAMTDKRFSSGDSVQNYAIRSAMCVPIKFKERLFGVIHVDSQVANFTYTEDQLRLLTAIGVHTGLALANVSLYSERLQRERLAAVGQTVASLSHSIKNILQGMRGGADLVELGLKKMRAQGAAVAAAVAGSPPRPAPTPDNMKIVLSGWEIVSRNLERIYGLTMNMLAYSKQRSPEMELTNLPKLLEEVVALVQQQFDNRQVALIVDFDQDMPPIPVDPGGVHQAVLNLLHNALDAVQPKTGAVSMRCEFDALGQRARVHVIDNGPGIDQENLKRLFEPFYSTKGQRGTGLGLVVTKKIVEEHGGTIDVDSLPSHGTTITLNFSLNPPSAPHSADTHNPAT